MTQTNQNNLTANAVAVESAIGNRQSAIGNRQSAIGNRQSAIGNRQSAIPLLCLIFCAALLTSGSQNATAETSHSVIPTQAGGNQAGDSFAIFYRKKQMELFSALDNVLSQKAEDTLTEFAAVKKADIQLQTQLGNRQGQIAANVIGAFAESQNSAFGWQVRVFGAENDTKGANAGIFFRRVDGESLYGINTFADYEKGNYGEFLRYGIGGELQNRYASFAMNYYLPITDDKRQGANVAFSQKGYDANLRINIPQMDYLKLRADYYHFDGKYGGEDDKGFRYGLELQPINDLRIGVFYDDGGEEFGGDIAYTYNFGNRQLSQKRESTADFSPDLFSPIVREYSQRILITTTERIEVLRTPISVMTTRMITPERVFTTAMTMAGMTTILTTETPTMTISRMASVYAIMYSEILEGDVTTINKYLLTLPSASFSPPYVLTITRNFRVQSAAYDWHRSGGAVRGQFPDEVITRTLTIVQGSEDFISVAITLTTENTTTVPHIITETPMTIAAMTITTKLTTFATSTITIGANIGAAIDNSHLPPSFPQVSKLALAAPVILARRAGIQHNRVAIIQKPRRQYAQ